MTASELGLYLHERRIGTVRPTRIQTRVSLEWDSSYDGSGPTLTESFGYVPGLVPSPVAVSNFLGGYTPEGNQRRAMADKRGINPERLFDLLTEFGGSIAGAVTLRQPSDLPTYQPTYNPLSDRALADRLRQAVNDHDLGARDDSRSMLPGFQPKFLAAKLDGEWFEPRGRAHSTHILKPQLRSRKSAIHDEFFSHQLARLTGLADYEAELLKANGVTFLALERYDRTLDSGRVGLRHQEDLAQAIGLDWRDPEAKFTDPRSPRQPGRPTAARIGELLGSIPDGTGLAEGWLRQLVFHVAIGNNDAHAKNVALLHDDGKTSLAPLYDAVPNLYQEDRISWNLALPINRVFDHRNIGADDLIAEAVSWEAMAPSSPANIVATTLTAIRIALEATHASPQTTPGMTDAVHRNVDRLLSGYTVGGSRSS